MATTPKRLCAGTFAASNATLYTAPSTSGNYTIVKAITLCNKTAGVVSVTLKLNGTELLYTYRLAAYDTITIPFVDQVLQAGELLEGFASAAASVNYYISGKEVT